MKQKDIALIIIVTFVSLVIALFVSNFLFSSTGSNSIEAEKVDSISSSFELPDKKYYNNESVNPTQIIRISGAKNEQLFNNEAAN